MEIIKMKQYNFRKQLKKLGESKHTRDHLEWDLDNEYVDFIIYRKNSEIAYCICKNIINVPKKYIIEEAKLMKEGICDQYVVKRNIDVYDYDTGIEIYCKESKIWLKLKDECLEVGRIDDKYVNFQLFRDKRVERCMKKIAINYLLTGEKQIVNNVYDYKLIEFSLNINPILKCKALNREYSCKYVHLGGQLYTDIYCPNIKISKEIEVQYCSTDCYNMHQKQIDYICIINLFNLRKYENFKNRKIIENKYIYY